MIEGNSKKSPAIYWKLLRHKLIDFLERISYLKLDLDTMLKHTLFPKTCSTSPFFKKFIKAVKQKDTKTVKEKLFENKYIVHHFDHVI